MRPKRTFIPELAYGTLGLGLGVIPLCILAAACTDDTGTDAVFGADAHDAAPDGDAPDGTATDGIRVALYDGGSPDVTTSTDAVYPYIAPDSGADAADAADASDAAVADEDAGDAEADAAGH